MLDDGDPDEHARAAEAMFDTDAILGVRHEKAADPGDEAHRLAEELGGEIIRDLEHAEAAFAARTEAGRTEAVVLDGDERSRLEEQARAARASAQMDGDREAVVDELRALAEQLRRTERIRERTQEGVTETLNRRLSASRGVTLHPDTIRAAAKALSDAEEEVATWDAAIAELGERPEAQRTPGSERAAEVTDDDLESPARSAPLYALGVGTSFAGAALILLELGVFVAVPIAVFLLGIVAAWLVLVRTRPTDDPDMSAGTEMLAHADTHVARSGLAEQDWLSRRAHLDATRERAMETYRSARRHWESLTGPGADHHDVEQLVRVRDPQFELVGAASQSSPVLRTVNAVHRRAMARWRVAWAAIGYDEPPALDDVERELQLVADGGGASQSAVARLSAADAWDDASATIDRPIILVEPSHWLEPGRLEAMLELLPAGADVIVVEQA